MKFAALPANFTMSRHCIRMPPFKKEAWIGSRKLTRKAQNNNKRINGGAVEE